MNGAGEANPTLGQCTSINLKYVSYKVSRS